MPNKNELLKDIAIKLGGSVNKPNNTTNELLAIIAQTFGATVTEKENDVNELLTLIRDNMPTGSGGGGAKLYKHTITLYCDVNDDGEYDPDPSVDDRRIVFNIIDECATPYETFTDLYSAMPDESRILVEGYTSYGSGYYGFVRKSSHFNYMNTTVYTSADCPENTFSKTLPPESKNYCLDTVTEL